MLALALGAICPGTMAAQTQPTRADIVATTVEKDSTTGQLKALSLRDGLIVRTDSDDERRIPLIDLVRITTSARLAERDPRNITLTLTDGDVLYGRIGESTGETMLLETADVGRLSVPLDVVAGMNSAQASSSAFGESVDWLDRVRADTEDCILLTNADVVRGFVTGINADGVAIESSLGETTIPHRLVLAVRLASQPSAKIDSPHIIVTLGRSGRLTATDLEWSDSVVEARLRFGERIRIEAERIVSIDVVGGRWEWLAQHQPISYEHTPMLSLDWKYVADRNVLGGPISVAGRSFEHGIGVHSRSSLTYDLQGAYTQFVTSFGIDDDSGPYADVSVLILVDGKRRFAQEHLRRGQLSDPLRLDVTRAKRIELIVDFGDNGDLQDRFNWVNPALIR